jgi:hypothetical protein
MPPREIVGWFIQYRDRCGRMKRIFRRNLQMALGAQKRLPFGANGAVIPKTR